MTQFDDQLSSCVHQLLVYSRIYNRFNLMNLTTLYYLYTQALQRYNCANLLKYYDQHGSLVLLLFLLSLPSDHFVKKTPKIGYPPLCTPKSRDRKTLVPQTWSVSSLILASIRLARVQLPGVFHRASFHVRHKRRCYVDPLSFSLAR